MPLWVGGLAIGILAVGAVLLPFSGEPFEWALYLLLGLLLPPLAIAVTAPRAPGSARAGAVASVQAIAATACVVVASPFVVRHVGAVTAALAVLTWTLGVGLSWRGRDPGSAPITRAERLVGLFVVTVSWTVSINLTWWRPLAGTRPGYALVALVGATLLATIVLCRFPSTRMGGSVRGLDFLLGVVVLAVVSARTEPVSRWAAHHWGAVVGPAELVRQGGWLLWDVPAQYGFLSTLTIAAIPSRTVWDAFYLLNAVLLFLTAVLLFLLLRGPRPGVLDSAFALALTMGVVFLTGSWNLPAIGPFRFFWCHALLAILYWRSRGGSASRPAYLMLGTLAWLAGTLWSAESAAYCAAIWLPAYPLLVVQEHGRGRPAAIVGRLAFPPLLLLSSCLFLAGYYRGRRGSGPDWPAFVEYARAFTEGVSARPIDPGGAVWGLLLILCAVATMGLRALAVQSALPTLALAWGAWAAVWATGSYFVSRSGHATAASLAPVYCLALAIALRLLPAPATTDVVSRLVRLAVAPVFAMLLAMTLAQAPGLVRSVRHSWSPRPSGIETLLPRADPALLELLARAGVGATDPVAYLDDFLNPLPTRPDGGGWTARHRAWLPTEPGALFMPLAEPRSRVYVARFVERARLGGWLIEPKLSSPLRLPWLVDQLQRTHAPTAVYENDAWRLTRFEPR
jgi:hypothetical protein